MTGRDGEKTLDGRCVTTLSFRSVDHFTMFGFDKARRLRVPESATSTLTKSFDAGNWSRFDRIRNERGLQDWSEFT